MRFLKSPIFSAFIKQKTPVLQFLNFSTLSINNKMADNNTIEEFKMKPRRNGDHHGFCPVNEYDSLLKDKSTILKNLMEPFFNGNLELFESPKTNFRMRANFQVWKDDPRKNVVSNEMYYGMWSELPPTIENDANNDENNNNPDEIVENKILVVDESIKTKKKRKRKIARKTHKPRKEICEVKSFNRGTIRMNNLMDELMTEMKTSRELYDGVFEARFVTTQTNDAVIVLVYKRPIDEKWKIEADKVAKKINAKIVGRSHKIKIIASGNYDDEIVEEIYNVKGKEIKLYLVEGAFSQPNSPVCEKMLTWAIDVTNDSKQEDLLELYCGGGTFTVALASNFRKVLATEVSKESVELANKTFASNNVNNIKICKLSSEDFTVAYTSNRPFSRLVDVGIRFKDYNLSTVLVDPPRAGVDVNTCNLLTKFNKIVYISCNPETLARDLGILTKTHDVVKLAAFDQFPYTHHLEAGVCLVKKVINDSTSELGKRKAIDDATV
jgi:tRNA (uracil-5-)-methyltransferase